jgi:hypothetical protein
MSFQNTTGNAYVAEETEIKEHLLTGSFLMHDLSPPGLQLD